MSKPEQQVSSSTVNVAAEASQVANIDHTSVQTMSAQKQKQKRRFGRQSSTPARFKLTASGQGSSEAGDESEIKSNVPHHSCECLNRHHMNRYSQCERIPPYRKYQVESHETHITPNINHQTPETTVFNHISSSSTSGDSAFSQSQTTLESESERSSLKCNKQVDNEDDEDADEHLRDMRNRSGSNRSSTSSEPGGDSSLLLSHELNNHFKIIWKDLSYQVPDKRFSRFRSYLRRKSEEVWPKDADPSELDERSIVESATIAGALALGDGNSTLSPVDLRGLPAESGVSDLNDVGPPLKPPTTGKPRKLIFSQLNGCIKSGQLTAILGPSGAGKTTFLKCLTNSISNGVTGTIDIVGGNPTSKDQLKLCIIPQKDHLFDNLTVMENLIFASRIKNTRPGFDHKQNVSRVAHLLGLQSCLKLKTNRLSGGQYKRVSIAQELLSRPDILILDEPTSGLDSLTCFRTVSVLKNLVDMSRAGLMAPLAIVMTIHQPQIKIFNLFHHVYILSCMGQCMYEGRPDYLIETVADCCKLLPSPDDLNPASFIIDLASEVYGSKPIEQLTQLQRKNSQTFQQTDNASQSNFLIGEELDGVEDNPKSYNPNLLKLKQPPSHLANQIVGRVGKCDLLERQDTKLTPQNQLKISDRLRRRNNQPDSFWLHTGLLVRRLWMSMWRDPLLTTTRITFHLIIPFVFYFVYSRSSGIANACPHVEREIDLQEITSDSNINRLATQHNELILTFENVSLFFILLYSFSMCVLAVTALSFPLNMQILLKETSNGWYSMPRFVMAKTLADLPIELTMPMISVAIAYVLTGQPSSYLCWRMLAVTAVMTLCSLISQTQGLLFGAYFMNNVQAAVFVSQASSLPWIMLSGFTTRVSTMPSVLRWLSFGSIYRLGIESIVAIRYGFGMCTCDQELVNNTTTKVVGVPDQLRSVIRYYSDVYSSSSELNNTVANSTGDIFEKVASTISRANTFGVDIVSCRDVRPFIMSAREVDEDTLPTFLLILVLIFVGLKVLLFCVVRLRAG